MYMYVYMCVYVCVYMCMCICMYIYICVCVYVCIYMYMHTRVGVHMHSCRRILFICTVQSLNYMRVYHRRFFNQHTGEVGDWKMGFLTACSWLAIVAGVGGYITTGVEQEFFFTHFSIFCGC